MIRFYRLIICLVVCSLPVMAQTHDGGSNSAEFLRIAPGARSAAMGDAFTAGSEGVLALHYNPALLGTIEKAEIEGGYQNVVLDIGQGSLAYAQPLGSHAGWGLLLSYLDYGTTKKTTFAGGAAIAAQEAGTFGGSDLSVGASFGYAFSDFGIGLSVKAVSSSIDDASSNAFAADLGLSWKPSETYEFGVALKNIGKELQFDQQLESLPVLFRAGAAVFLFDRKLRFNADVEKVRQEELHLMTGVEYQFGKHLSLRAGWDGRNDVASGITTGVGVSMKTFSLDYAFIPAGNFGSNHRFGLRYDFGAKRDDVPKVQEKKQSQHSSEKLDTSFSEWLNRAKAPLTSKKIESEKLSEESIMIRREKIEVVTKKPQAQSEPEIIEEIEEVVPKKPEAQPEPNQEKKYGSRAAKFTAYMNEVRAIQSYLISNPDDFDAWRNLGIIQIENRDFRSARKSFKKAVKVRPRDTETLGDLAECQFKLGYRKDAAKQWQRILEINPDHETARKKLELLQGY